MDAQERAIAALQHVVESTNHPRDGAGKFASTAIDMNSSTTHNTIVPMVAGAQKPRQILELSERLLPGTDEGRGHSNDGTAGLTLNISDDNSQSAADSHDAATPPTSDGFSSQGTNQDNPLCQLSQLSQLAAAQRPLESNHTRPKLAVSPTAGQKRTADGHVKGTRTDTQLSPNKRGHSRNVSAVSNVSSTSGRIGEVRFVVY